MKKKITVLGAGLVGSAIARDLSSQHDVLSVDINSEALAYLSSFGIKTKKADLSDATVLKNLAETTDLFIGAVPGFMGYKTVEHIINLGKNIVDISFFPEDAFGLDQLAKDKGVIAVVDCGVAPGMGNVILGYENTRMKIDSYDCRVGGLPIVRTWPYEYKAVFSPRDVIEEYTRPARYIVNGQLVTKEALTDVENAEYGKAGTLESWNSDGLRSLLKTMAHIPNLIEKTLRYPGTTEYIRVLRATGLFSETPVKVGEHSIKPIDLTSKLLFPMWKLQPGEREFTVMKIILEGTENGRKIRRTYDLFDEFDDEKGITSMARTTGYTCTAAANMVLDGLYNQKGVSPPEFLGTSESYFKFILNYLQERNITYHMTEENI